VSYSDDLSEIKEAIDNKELEFDARWDAVKMAEFITEIFEELRDIVQYKISMLDDEG
jgi:hypothetical protein